MICDPGPRQRHVEQDLVEVELRALTHPLKLDAQNRRFISSSCRESGTPSVKTQDCLALIDSCLCSFAQASRVQTRKAGPMRP